MGNGAPDTGYRKEMDIRAISHEVSTGAVGRAGRTAQCNKKARRVTGDGRAGMKTNEAGGQASTFTLPL